jgi:ABC-type antimicrobial peptide transport system permease subunit
MIAREAFVLVGVGSGAGTVLAIVAFRFLLRYLAGVSELDPAIAVTCAFAMFLAGAVALPAIRGCRVDPLTALRHE